MAEKRCAICGYVRHLDNDDPTLKVTHPSLKTELYSEDDCPVCHAPADLLFFEPINSDLEIKK